MIEDELIDGFIESRNNGELNYFSLDIVQTKFDAELLAKRAIEKKQANALGYLCEITYQALPDYWLKTKERVKLLYENLRSNKFDWEFLDYNAPAFGKRMLMHSPQTYENKKWQIYSNLRKEELVDWFDIYLRLQDVSPR